MFLQEQEARLEEAAAADAENAAEAAAQLAALQAQLAEQAQRAEQAGAEGARAVELEKKFAVAKKKIAVGYLVIFR